MRRTIAALALTTSLYASDLSDYVMKAGLKVPPTADTNFTAYILPVPAPKGYTAAQLQYSVYPNHKPDLILTLTERPYTMVMITDDNADEAPDRVLRVSGATNRALPLDAKLREIYRTTIKDVRKKIAEESQLAKQ